MVKQMLDAETLKNDFPLLSKQMNGKPIIYLDSACMALKPTQVIDSINEYYTNYSGCAGRSPHKIGDMVTQKVYESRTKIREFINAKKPEEIVFTKNTTEAINLISRSLKFDKQDTVLTSDREHNSNLVPWLLLEKNTGIKHEVVESNADMTFNIDSLKQKLETGNVKLVSMVHTSNLDGYTTPASEIIKAAHDHGAFVLLDAAQSAAHAPMDVQKLDVDFMAFSGHKMCGPTGTGVLYGKKKLLEDLDPFLVGGETVSMTHYDKFELRGLPDKFEAGLQNYAGILGLGSACDYLQNVGLDKIHKHELGLNKMITDALSEIDIHPIGPQDPELRGGVFSFVPNKLDAASLAVLLDESANVMVRSGAHCMHSWFNARGLDDSVRASMYLYNTEEDIEVFVDTMKSTYGTL